MKQREVTFSTSEFVTAPLVDFSLGTENPGCPMGETQVIWRCVADVQEKAEEYQAQRTGHRIAGEIWLEFDLFPIFELLSHSFGSFCCLNFSIWVFFELFIDARYFSGHSFCLLNSLFVFCPA